MVVALSTGAAVSLTGAADVASDAVAVEASLAGAAEVASVAAAAVEPDSSIKGFSVD